MTKVQPRAPHLIYLPVVLVCFSLLLTPWKSIFKSIQKKRATILHVKNALPLAKKLVRVRIYRNSAIKSKRVVKKIKIFKLLKIGFRKRQKTKNIYAGKHKKKPLVILSNNAFKEALILTINWRDSKLHLTRLASQK